MPLFYAFSFIGLDYTWIAFPVSETMTTIVGLILYIDQLKKWKCQERLEKERASTSTKDCKRPRKIEAKSDKSSQCPKTNKMYNNSYKCIVI